MTTRHTRSWPSAHPTAARLLVPPDNGSVAVNASDIPDVTALPVNLDEPAIRPDPAWI
jgi:hypothetical protein